jgi:hypothetical protein
METRRENGAGGGVQSSGLAEGLCCSTDISMMEATDFAKRHDPARLRRFDEPHLWRILVER